jgi:riboflavin kinase / FMN adenylyltransferase
MWHVIADASELAPDEPAVFALSEFDGVHRAHQDLVHRAVELASDLGTRLVLATCWPPVAGELTTHLLTTRKERADLLHALAGDATLLDCALPTDSTDDVLDAIAACVARAPRIAGVVTDPSLAARLEARRPQLVAETRWLAILTGSEPSGAARIRALLGAGDVRAAERLLGRPYALSGVVVEGDRRGRELGFPTANLRVDPLKLIPSNGIYVVRARVAGAAYGGAASIGVRPTFGTDGPRLVEVHVLDEQPNLYGRTLEVEFVERLRAEERFDSVDALVAQMRADVARAREVLAAAPAAH